MGSECDLGAAGVAFMPHGVEQERMMLPSRETERSEAECGGRLAYTVYVPESSRTCSPLDSSST